MSWGFLGEETELVFSEITNKKIITTFSAIPGFKFFAELSGRIRFSQKNEWSKASQTSIQTRKRSTISVPGSNLDLSGKYRIKIKK